MRATAGGGWIALAFSTSALLASGYLEEHAMLRCHFGSIIGGWSWDNPTLKFSNP